MEGANNSKASSDEASSQEPPGGDVEAASSPPAAASRPYYECVFCKRGFTTAQALGGHMNIHRRDRAKAGREAPAAATSVSRAVDCYSPYGSAAFLRQSANLPAAAAPGSFTMYYPPVGSGGRDPRGLPMDGEVSPSSPRELSLFGGEELHLGLGRYAHGDRSRAPEGSEQRVDEAERELDLELRLGHRPRR